MLELISKYHKQIKIAAVIAGTAAVGLYACSHPTPEQTTFKGGGLPDSVPTPRVLEYNFDFKRSVNPKHSLLFSPYNLLPPCPDGSTEWRIIYRKVNRGLGFYDLLGSIPYKGLDGDIREARSRLFINAKNPDGFYSGDADLECGCDGKILSSTPIRYRILLEP